MRYAARPPTLHACCSVMTVTLATTRTAWILHCSLCPRVAGSASGKDPGSLQGQTGDGEWAGDTVRMDTVLNVCV